MRLLPFLFLALIGCATTDDTATTSSDVILVGDVYTVEEAMAGIEPKTGIPVVRQCYDMTCTPIDWQQGGNVLMVRLASEVSGGTIEVVWVK